jgi:predicted dehydrogenase
MKKLAIVRGAGAYHGRAFAGIINECDKAAFRDKGWPDYPSALSERAVVTHVWDPDPAVAGELAEAAGIDNVPATLEEIIGQVDGVLVTDDGTLKHQESALPFLEAGVPTFVDKPLSTDVAEAERIVALAQKHSTPFFSASALRFAVEIADRQALLEQVGEITMVSGATVNEIVYYGVHPLEAIVALMGPGIESVINVGRPGSAIVRLRWKDGRQAVLIAYEEGFAYTLEVTVHGPRGHARIPINDSAGFYTNMLAAFLDMIDTGEPPFPASETVEIIRALVLAKESVAEGGVEKRM